MSHDDRDLSDEATDAALAQFAAGRRVDHDFHLRVARTRMNAWRAGFPWGVPADLYGAETAADFVLLGISEVETSAARDAVEAIAVELRRPYDEVLARRRRLLDRRGR